MNKPVADSAFHARVRFAAALSRQATTGAFMQALADSARVRHQLRFPAVTPDFAGQPEVEPAVEAA